MVNTKIKSNAAHLEREMSWLSELLRARIGIHQGTLTESDLPLEPPACEGESVYAEYIHQLNLAPEERVVLALALVPYVRPCLVERILQDLKVVNADLPELGGIKGSQHPGMLPTGETALFILAGGDIEKRLNYARLFSPQHKLNTCGLLKLGDLREDEPEQSGMIQLSKDALAGLTSGVAYTPPFNSRFPAKRIMTGYEHGQLVVHPETEKGLQEISAWLDHRDDLLQGLGFSKKISAGYKCLFYGPPGTGKSLTAALLGKERNLPVYRIDLSMVVSKYVGETEKSISNIFDIADGKDWILFFDEADSLFGKRSSTQTAQDRFANQEVSHLLMRMEEYNGVAILATNFRENIDKAFLRRFNSLVQFPLPGPAERLRLWSQSFSSKTLMEADVRLEDIAKNFSLSGSNIMNVARYASMMMLKNGKRSVQHSQILEGIRRELSKEQILTDSRP